MVGLGEQIDRLRVKQLVAIFLESGHVTRPGRGIAAHVRHALGARRSDALHHAVCQARTRRIDDERVELARRALADEGVSEGVDVRPLTGLLVDFCHEIGAGAVVKGLRAMTDFEYELQQADLNSRLAPDVESIFVMSSPEYGYVSSSIVRQLAGLGADVSMLVPPCVVEALRARF